MKNSLNLLTRCAVVIGACHGASALADTAPRDPQDQCYWRPPGAGIKSYVQDLGTLYIPRDAKVGSVIGSVDRTYVAEEPADLTIYCLNNGTVRLEADMRATAPIFPGQLDPINGEDVTGKILQTNIPGVGVRIKLGFPFNGRSDNSFFPEGGSPTVPFLGFNERVMLTGITVTWLNHSVTLVKTGDIPVGPNQLNGSELFSGTFSNIGNVLRYGITGTIIPAQCTVGGNPVSADPVQLGEWDASDFTGPGYATTAVPFTITLSNCDTDASGAFDATANILLDGVQGSAPVGPTTSGVFSLTTDSTAEGMGIQILKADGITPLELQAELPLITITPGDTVLNFSARFYQTGASNTIRPGLAKGALSFTVSYK